MMSSIASHMTVYTSRSMKWEWEWALQRTTLDLHPDKYEFGKLPSGRLT
ncbi:MAG: hypothetical protein ACKVHP_08505 [Verrucomicrobiales bacterium]